MSIQNVPTGKTGLPFQNFGVSQEFSTGTNQKNVYHLHPNRNFQEFVVNGKQPLFQLIPDTFEVGCLFLLFFPNHLLVSLDQIKTLWRRTQTPESSEKFSELQLRIKLMTLQVLVRML